MDNPERYSSEGIFVDDPLGTWQTALAHSRWRPLLAAASLAIVSCAGSPEVREFRGAYPADAAPNGTVRAFELTAAPARVQLFDGRPLDVWAYNGQVPGPILRVRLGDTVRATLLNRLPQPTTIHWHGVRVPNAMDGVPGITQPPVEPGEHFVYEFTPKDAGTFWFHPHLSASEQVERGLFGVLIVEDAEPPPYSGDLLWVLDDWLLTPEGEIFPQFNTRHDLAHDGRWGNVVTVNGRSGERLVVRPGERFRLRLLNVANGRVFTPDFADLDVKVIAVDGMYTGRPLAPADLELAPGNRIDLDVTVPADWQGKRIAVRDRFTRRPIDLAEIVVSGEPVAAPRFDSPARAQVPTWQRAEVQPTRAEYQLASRTGGRFGIEWTLNGEAFAHAAHGGHGDSRPRQVTTLPLGEWSKLRFVNQSYRLHPMHIHGQFFKLLSRNGARVEEPFWRDTVLLHPKEQVEIGLVPLDAGEWMLHCHVLEHAEAGMMTLVTVR